MAAELTALREQLAKQRQQAQQKTDLAKKLQDSEELASGLQKEVTSIRQHASGLNQRLLELATEQAQQTESLNRQVCVFSSPLSFAFAPALSLSLCHSSVGL